MSVFDFMSALGHSGYQGSRPARTRHRRPPVEGQPMFNDTQGTYSSYISRLRSKIGGDPYNTLFAQRQKRERERLMEERRREAEERRREQEERLAAMTDEERASMEQSQPQNTTSNYQRLMNQFSNYSPAPRVPWTGGRYVPPKSKRGGFQIF